MPVLLYLAVLKSSLGHGAMTYPPPREGIDGNVAPWNGSVPHYPLPFQFWCASPNSQSSDPRKLTGVNGQACFWFSNGCDISCDECDGNTGQAIHPSFIYNGTDPNFDGWTGEGIIPDPEKTQPSGGQAKAHAICPQNRFKRNATICDPNLRTVNVNAECGGPEDFYYFAPWRAPGTAPVIDACGVAGGRLPGQGPGTAGADYQNTTNAVLGDRGSLLPELPHVTPPTWKAGSIVEVAWVVKAYHGGGYSYRLCPADEELTEECFQKTPLDFAGLQSFRWGGVGGKQIWFDGTYITEGTNPKGSMWAKNPIPGGPWGYALHGATFPPKCDEPKACRESLHEKAPFMTCQCSGEGVGDIPTLEVLDKVRLPAALKPGKWVVGWRWDCEESTQVWQSCGDVIIE